MKATKKKFIEWLVTDFVSESIESARKSQGCVYLTILEEWDEEGNPLQEINIELSLGEVLTFSFKPEELPDTMDMQLKIELGKIVKTVFDIEVLHDGSDWDAFLECENPKEILRYMEEQGCHLHQAIEHIGR